MSPTYTTSININGVSPHALNLVKHEKYIKMVFGENCESDELHTLTSAVEAEEPMVTVSPRLIGSVVSQGRK